MGSSVILSMGMSTALDWKKSVITCISCSSWTEVNLLALDFVKKTNSEMISKTSSVSLGDSETEAEAVGDAFRAAAERLLYRRLRASWLKFNHSSLSHYT